jgi:hypothetical protein
MFIYLNSAKSESQYENKPSNNIKKRTAVSTLTNSLIEVAVLVGKNRSLNQSLEQERGRGGRVHRASTVEEEVLALNPAR